MAPLVGSGIATQVVSIAETTFGVAPALTGARAYEVKSETLELKKTTVQGQGLHAGGFYDRARRRVLTNYDVQGAIVMDLPTRQMAYWCQYMVGSFGQTLATPTQIATTGVYKSVHQGAGGAQVLGSPQGHSLVVQKGIPAVDGTVEPFTYVGTKVTSWELKVSTGSIAELTLTLDARNELGGGGNADPLNGSVPSLLAWPGLPTSGLGTQLFHFRQATLFTGGTPTYATGIVSLVGETAAANVKDADIQHSFTMDNARYFLGSAGFKAEQLENGFRKINGTLTVEWLSSEAMYNAFAADTTTSLQLTFVGPTVGASNYLFDVIIPNIKLDGETPKASGPAVITQSVTFTGLDDEVTCPIQIIYQSEDTII